MVVRELNALIRDANYLLILLPIANFIYLYSKDESGILFFLAITTCFVTAYIFNLTSGYPRDDNGDFDSSEVHRALNILYGGTFISWLALWGYSLYRLHAYIGSPDLIAAVLFFGSIAWAAMLMTHGAFAILITNYSNPMYKFGEWRSEDRK